MQRSLACLKKWAVSMLTPMAAKTMANSASSSPVSCVRAASQHRSQLAAAGRPCQALTEQCPAAAAAWCACGAGKPRKTPQTRLRSSWSPPDCAHVSVCQGGAHHEVLLAPLLGLVGHQAGLPADLGRDVVVRQPRSREQRDLLPARQRKPQADGCSTRAGRLAARTPQSVSMAHVALAAASGSAPPGDGVHGVDGGDAGLDHLFRVRALGRVDGGPIDVQEGLCQHRRPAASLHEPGCAQAGCTGRSLPDCGVQQGARTLDYLSSGW